MDETLNEPVETGQVEQRESTGTDYWNTVNPFAIQFNNPQVRFNAATDSKGVIDFEDPMFKAAYDAAPIETKRSMVQANNTSDALKIAERSQIFYDAQKAIEQDGLMTQIGMGILPALASPTSLIPGGAYVKAAQLSKRINRIVAFAGIGAGTAAAANVLDEAIFDAQGMPTNYVNAAAIGAIFGGGLGALGGVLSGPYNKTAANALHPDNDSFAKDYDIDPIVNSRLDENGVVQLQDIAQMDKSITDRIPFIGDWLRSDVHTVYQGESSLLRQYMGRMSSATVSLRDSAGNLLPVRMTGIDFKRKTKGIHNRLTYETDVAYESARVNGFKGTRDDFNTEIYRVYIDEVNRQKKEAIAYANMKTRGIDMSDVQYGDIAKFEREYKGYMEEWYSANQPMFKGDPDLVKGAEAYRNYFTKMLDNGKSIGMEQLTKLSSNRLYAPRVYNYRGLHTGEVSEEVARQQLRDALQSDPRNGFTTKEELDKLVDSVYEKLMNSAFDLNNLTNSFLVKDLPFETHLKSRKLYLDETKMPDLLVRNFEDLAGMYHYKMSGRQATHFAFGTDELTKIMDEIRQEHLEKGTTFNPKEIQAFERTVKDLLGDLRMNGLSDTPSWTFTRNLMTYNSTRMGGGFGGNQAIELAATTAINGVDAILSGRFKTSLVNAKNLLYTKGKDIDDFSEYLINSGFMSDALHTSRVNRYADTEIGFNSGTVEKTLNGLNDTLMKYNGMRYFMGVMEDYTGGAVVTRLKKGDVDEKMLARWGMTKAEAKELQGALKQATKGDKWDLGSMDEALRDRLQLAVIRGVEEVVIHGDSIHLPAWMKVPAQFKQVIFQFMRFPLIAQEVLTRRGFKEEQAKMAAAIVASSLTYMSLKYLREQASIAIGAQHEIDSKYDYFNDKDAVSRSLLESLNYNAPLGFMTSVYNYSAVALGQPELGRDWQGKYGMPNLLGPSYGLGEDIIQLLRAGVEGELDTERNMQRFKSMTPFLNLPLINEAGKAFVEEYGR